MIDHRPRADPASGASILIVDADASDRALATLLTQRELPDATVVAPADLLAFTESLLTRTPDLAVIAASAAWAPARHLIDTVRERSPRTAIIVFGTDAELLSLVASPGVACDGVLQKTSAGFLALAALLRSALGRRAHAMPAAAPHPETPSVPAESGGQDMRDVALVVSHDVCEPLQQIVRLVRRAEPVDGVQGRTFQQVVECAERAVGTLDRLVDYLSVGVSDAEPRPVDLNACLNQALENLRNLIQETGAEVRSVFLPMSSGHETQIVHLFQNLVSNAIKFRGPERPLITISVEPRPEQWLLAFRDNGVGIPSGFTDKIFDLGKRLHTREERPGHGVGLALCRRIVERHGGRIWSESREGGGSTFYFLLPRVSADVARPA